MLAIINYHYIRSTFEAEHPAIFGVTPDAFRKQLHALSNYGQFVSQQMVRDHVLYNTPLPVKSILITFDDGLKEQYEEALPILDELNIPAVFFINTKVLVDRELLNVHLIHLVRSLLSPKEILNHLNKSLDLARNTMLSTARQEGIKHYKYDDDDSAELKYLLNFILPHNVVRSAFLHLLSTRLKRDLQLEHQRLYMNRRMVQELGRKGYIGSHAHDHLPIGLLAEQEAEEEVKKSQEILSELLGHNVFSFSYPYGSQEAIGKTDQILNKHGFVFSLSMHRRENNLISPPYCLNRFDNNDVPMGKAYGEGRFAAFEKV